MNGNFQKMKSRGFSFIEILFAIICLGFLLAPIFSIFSQGSAVTMQNRNDILAQQYATNLLAYVYALPYDHVFLKPGSRRIDDLQVNADSVLLDLGMEEGMFNRNLNVYEQKPANWPFAYKIITIKVQWKQASEASREIKIAGLVSQ